jgi:hypothetical protein
MIFILDRFARIGKRCAHRPFQAIPRPYAPDPFLKIANRSQNCFPAVPSFRLSLVATARNYTSLGGEIGREIIQNS